MERKYEFTEETTNTDGAILHRIKAVRDFGDVKKGDVGGFIEKEENLSQDGIAWVYGRARVYGNTRISGNVHIHGDVRIYGNARISGNAGSYSM